MTPRDRSVDGPLLGNGDMGIAVGGPPEALKLYLCKNDFWRLQHQADKSCPLPLGHLAIDIPALQGASYHVEQDIYTATTRGVFEIEGGRVALMMYVAAGSNHLVIELGAEGQAFEGSVALNVKEGRDSENESGRTGNVFWGKRAFTKDVDIPTGAAAAWKLLGSKAAKEDGSFELIPGQKTELVLGMESLFKHKEYVKAAVESVEALRDTSALRRGHTRVSVTIMR